MAETKLDKIADTTITDKKGYNSDIVDNDKYKKLTDAEKKIFKQLRDSMLEIFPLTDGKHDALCRQLAENFAFINLKAIKSSIDIMVEEKLKKLETDIKSFIATSIKSSTTTTTGK